VSTFGLQSVEPALAETMIGRLNDVERALVMAAKADDPFIDEAASYLLNAGGKRFRPMLTLLAAQLGQSDSDDVVKAAVAVELVHLASLYHDDVMDEAPRRRGAESANTRWTNTIAILTGDFLFARSSGVLADLGPEAVRIQAETFERLVSGQIRETVGPVDGEDPVAHHLRVLGDKTGVLIATAARYGAMFSGCSEDAIEALRLYGEAVGVAFQIADDILDIASSGEISGKTPGTDLREGVMTLPMLLVQAANMETDAHLLSLLGRPLADDVEHAEALALLRENHAMDQAKDTARQWASAAAEALAPIRAALAADMISASEDSPELIRKQGALSALLLLCDDVVNRVS
jgi:heptaprenyl diphosphate synthase